MMRILRISEDLKGFFGKKQSNQRFFPVVFFVSPEKWQNPTFCLMKFCSQMLCIYFVNTWACGPWRISSKSGPTVP